MSTTAARSITIVGAGLAGALLALLFARRGLQVTLYERRPDPRQAHPEQGRSINLALAARGMRALERAGVMRGGAPTAHPDARAHGARDPVPAQSLQPYGQRADEVIWSVGRAALNRVLIEAAARHAGVTVHFSHACLGVDPAADRLRLRNTLTGAQQRGCTEPDDRHRRRRLGGAHLRSPALAAVAAREDWLDHDYKELTIPAHATAGTPSSATRCTSGRAAASC